MDSKKQIQLDKAKILNWASQYNYVAYYDSCNNLNDRYYNYDCLIAVSNTNALSKTLEKYNECDLFKQLNKLQNNSENWLFGYLGYDLKNEVEKLVSENKDHLEFPDVFFFEPEILFLQKNGNWTIESKQTDFELKHLIREIETYGPHKFYLENKSSFKIKNRIDYSSYQKKISAIKEDIENGIYYELNLCREFYLENVSINPYQAFKDLCDLAQPPMAAFLKMKDQFIISASPERFLKKIDNKIIAQPMKGTIKRAENKVKDDLLKQQLKNSEKERAENVMIVDLMRNDLTRSSKLGSINVDNLFEVKSYKGFHTMVSTISATLRKDISPVEAIKNAFPIGSMTGAPKVKVLEKIEEYENTKRGIYAGAIGYFTPKGDFDFNVVIRTLLYNVQKKYLSFHTGGAIVYDSTAKAEYKETELKAENIIKILKQ